MIRLKSTVARYNKASTYWGRRDRVALSLLLRPPLPAPLPSVLPLVCSGDVSDWGGGRRFISTYSTSTFHTHTSCLRCFSTISPSSSSSSSSPSPASSSSSSSSSSLSWWDGLGILFFLSVAAFTATLGIWQVQRRAWKIDLINRRQEALAAPPIELAQFLRENPSASSSSSSSSSVTSHSECRQVRFSGRLLYGDTQIVGPRTAPSADGASTAMGGVGFFLITPVAIENKDAQSKQVTPSSPSSSSSSPSVVLLNRGWVPSDLAQTPSAVRESKTDGPINIVAMLRKGEERPQFLPSTYDGTRSPSFVFLDLPAIARQARLTHNTNTAGKEGEKEKEKEENILLFDAVAIENGNDRIRRRPLSSYLNFSTTPTIHTVYACTWFTLSAALLALTWRRFGTRAWRQGSNR